MSRSFQRELSLWADFNSIDELRRITTSLRFAASAERPAVGEIVRLHDDEGNAVLGVVEKVEGMTVHVRPETATWATSITLDLPASADVPFVPRTQLQRVLSLE